MRSRTLACTLLFGVCLAKAQAQTIIYNNTTNFSAAGFANGGATVITGDDLTKIVADDINFASNSPGALVTSFSFSVANFNATAVTARPLVRFYLNNGTGGGPGTLLGGVNFAPISFTGGNNVSVFNSPTGSYFTVPSSDTIWAGITFDDNNGTTGATAAQLNNLGQGLFNPPTVGSSQNAFFQSTSAGSFASSNPTGSFLFFGGTPVANFGWRFSAITPEPGAWGLLLGLGLSGASFLKRRKSRKK